MSDPKKYDVRITIIKAAPPLVLILAVQALRETLKTQHVNIPSDDFLYGSALSLYRVFVGLKNWLKNRKKKSILDAIKPI